MVSLMGFVEPRVATILGDILEIGVCKGDLTHVLAGFAKLHGKTVYAIDICNIDFNNESNMFGVYFPDYYRRMGLTPENQEAVICEALKGFNNVKFIKADSMKVTFPPNQKFCLAVIDGCHKPEHVKSDFALSWKHLSTHGLIVMHDYKGDLPSCTVAIDEIIHEYSARGELKLENITLLDSWWVAIQKDK